MMKAIHSDGSNYIQVIIIHDLQLVPRYWTWLTFQQTKTCSIRYDYQTVIIFELNMEICTVTPSIVGI